MSSRIATRAMTAVASSSNAGAPAAKTSINAKSSKDQTGRANTTKGKSKKRQKTHHHTTTVDAMPDPRAPKKARCGYELFLLSGGVELQVGNIIKKVVSLA